MSRLLCPRCENGGDLEWEKPDDIDLEAGIIICRTCRSRYQGIPGWQRATEKKDAEVISGPNVFDCLQILFNDHPAGSAGTVGGRWIVADKDGKTVTYGSGMTDAAQRYVHLRYGQGPVRRTLP